MTDWSLPSKDLALIRKAGDPPQDPNSALRDPDWSHLFFRWAEDKRDGGNPQLLSRQTNHCQGKLTMAEKGGAFSTGKIEVVGSNDKDKFKSALRDFSKKKITFA
jgi:hypothetical protein